MEQLDYKNINSIISLLEENDLPVSDIHSGITFFVEKQDNKVIAVGGLESAGDDAIIRSIAVSDNYKSQGFGSAITRHLINHAKINGIKDIYLLTTTAEKFFPRYGFKKIDRQVIPVNIKNSTQYKDVCPDSAVVMKLDFTRDQ